MEVDHDDDDKLIGRDFVYKKSMSHKHRRWLCNYGPQHERPLAMLVEDP